ncbi:pyrroline-5-carboxylate reductase [Bacillus rubiinfantis]|uniref:pyrroline-5-carboxylate reductase n=1 Tax=Bacillus rubiinfantis TaxID=1499680 RepID=UPI0005AB367A|nr:pyrroline-5-carboxylate reductase [Bacillus rubiinfantis]
MKKMAIIGGGAMAEALISGMIVNQFIKSEDIWVTNRANQQRLQYLETDYSVNTSYDYSELFLGADIVILAVKPKDTAAVMERIRKYVTEEMLIVSVLAGISLKTIELLAGKSLAIARAMPNTSAAVGKSATAIAVNQRVTEKQLKTIQRLFETVGLATFVEEKQLDAVTGLSGSGPAYIYYLIEAMENSAREIGLEQQIAKELIVQTLIGAAEMVKSSAKSAKQLRLDVTSPGGTTEAGVQVLEDNEVQRAFISCIKAAAARSKTMGESLRLELKVH